MKVKFFTLGCKVNQYETQSMTEALQNKGFEITTDSDADIFVVNSCTVTASADQKTRQAVRKFKRKNPNSIVVLTGCMPQAYPEKSKQLLEADIILGNKTNNSLPEVLCEYLKTKNRTDNISKHETGDPFIVSPITSFDERTRASVKIQDGCNRFCSYCIIPYSRGRVRSKPLDELKKELYALSQNGFKEIVLVGINLSSYGSDISQKFYDAVRLADDIDGIERVRLGSLEPDHLTDEVITELAKCKKLCPHFHLSLQSGCNNTLKTMNRHYTAEEYKDICTKLRKRFKDCTITTDVMVGFSGETQQDFEDSLSFVKEIAFEKVHVFPYSVREGTKAAGFKNHLTTAVKEQRCRIMIDECEKIRRSFFENQIGKTYSVIFETKGKDGLCVGHTANYIPIKAKVENFVSGMTADVKITDVLREDFCLAEVIS